MHEVPVVAVGLEEPWLRGQFEKVVRGSGGAAERFTPADRCPPDAVACVILTDDFVSPRLRAALVAARRYLPPERLAVFSWDPLSEAGALPGLGGVTLLRPERDEDEDVAAAIVRMLSPPGSPAPLDLKLAPCLPHALNYALRLLIERAGRPDKPAPPRTIVALAIEARCNRPNLMRRARAYGIPLQTVCHLTSLRWLRLAIRRGALARPELAAAVGYGSVRGLRWFVRSELDLSLTALGTVPLSEIDNALRIALAPVLVDSGRPGRPSDVE